MARGGCAAPGARDPSRFARARCMLYVVCCMLYIITEIKARLEEGLPPFHEIRLFQGEREIKDDGRRRIGGGDAGRQDNLAFQGARSA